MKSQKNYTKAFAFKDFIRAVFDIKNNVQITKRYIKGKLFANANAFEEIGVGDNMEYILFNKKRRTIITEDPITGERKETPFTQEQEKKLKETGML